MDQVVKVGVFDSGVGGLTVATKIFHRLPWVSVIYFGDTAHVPYGNKTVDQLQSYADQIASFFVEQGVVGILAACNTSSSVSLDFLQEKYSQLPVIGVVEPGVKDAIALTRNANIGLIATEATVKSKAHQLVAAKHSEQVNIFAQSCPKYVPLVEAGEVRSQAAKEATEEYLSKLMEHNIDTLILGCTHYPFLAEVISDYVGPNVKLVDPAKSTVDMLAQVLKDKGYHTANRIEHSFYVSGDNLSFKEVGARLVGAQYLGEISHVDLD
ncbi:MAG: glutamate racemase [Bacillota bacterium]|nr:glutamate racemase [Bacillota bacterium]